MITSVSIVAPLATQLTLGFHPVYLALAIGCGSKPLPWMNDSGFWIVGRLSGFTEKETLKSWTPMLTLIAVIGLVEAYVFSKILPFT